jgi:hypothetical protein
MIGTALIVIGAALVLGGIAGLVLRPSLRRQAA